MSRPVRIKTEDGYTYVCGDADCGLAGGSGQIKKMLNDAILEWNAYSTSRKEC